MKISQLASLLLLPIASAKLVKLNDSNFASATQDKIVFVKFFAPWCGHCKAMAADWEKLADEVTDPNIMIAEVDCTAEDSEQVCDENDVEGFPTLKFGDSAFLDDYEGGRDFESMSSFAKTSLKATCSPKNIDLCSDDQKEIIGKFLAMSLEDLEEKLVEVEDELDDMDEKFEASTDDLQSRYEEMQAKTEATKNDAKKKADYGILKAVLASKSSGGEL